MPRESAEWFVMVAGARVGPLTRVELSLQIESGTVDGDSHVWKKGMAEWQHGADIAELHSLFDPNSPPPSPPPKPRASATRPGGDKPGALKPATSASSGGASSKARAARPEDAKKGMVELDTAHFRIASQVDHGESKKGEGGAEFDTGHFSQQEIEQLKRAARAADDEAVGEFSTGHFSSQEIEELKEAASAGEHGARSANTIELDRQRPPHQLGVSNPIDVNGAAAKRAAMATAPGRPASSPNLSRPASMRIAPRPPSGRGFTPVVPLKQVASRPGTKRDSSGSIAAILVVCLALAGLATIFFLLQ